MSFQQEQECIEKCEGLKSKQKYIRFEKPAWENDENSYKLTVLYNVRI